MPVLTCNRLTLLRYVIFVCTNCQYLSQRVVKKFSPFILSYLAGCNITLYYTFILVTLTTTILQGSARFSTKGEWAFPYLLLYKHKLESSTFCQVTSTNGERACAANNSNTALLNFQKNDSVYILGIRSALTSLLFKTTTHLSGRQVHYFVIQHGERS